MEKDRHTISALVENKPGVLARIAGLFSARGFNIDSLAVGETEDPSVSRMTIVVKGDERVLEQVVKQLNKLVDVIKVQDYLEIAHLERDLALVKVRCNQKTRSEILEVARSFSAKVLDHTPDSVILEIAAPPEKVENCVQVLRPYGIREMCRTGVVAMARGGKALQAPAEGSAEKEGKEKEEAPAETAAGKVKGPKKELEGI